MKSLIRISTAVAVLAVVTSNAQSQVQEETRRAQAEARLVAPGPTNDNKLTLLESKGVQEDLKVTAEQVKSVKELADRFKEATKTLKGAAAFQKSRELIQQNQLALAKLLTAEQYRRLDQLEVQQKGPSAFFDPQVAKELDLKNEQRTLVQQILRDSFKKQAEIVRDAKGNQAQIQEKVSELNKSVVEEVVKSLTDGQKGTWKTLVGEPFKGTLPQAAGAGSIRPIGPAIDGIPPPAKSRRN